MLVLERGLQADWCGDCWRARGDANRPWRLGELSKVVHGDSRLLMENRGDGWVISPCLPCGLFPSFCVPWGLFGGQAMRLPGFGKGTLRVASLGAESSRSSVDTKRSQDGLLVGAAAEGFAGIGGGVTVIEGTDMDGVM